MQLIHPSYHILTPIDSDAILQSLEIAGRICYKSEDKITSESAPKFCKMLLGRNHQSVIEHISLSVKFIINRGVSHELVRHRLASFSQESTRYCDYNKKGIVFTIPPWIDIPEGEYKLCKRSLFGYKLDPPCIMAENSPGPLCKSTQLFLLSLLDVEEKYNLLLDEGWKPEQARDVLPNALKTEIVMTANLREWRHVLKLRTDKSAHPEMRQIMRPLLEELKGKVGVIFDDISYE